MSQGAANIAGVVDALRLRGFAYCGPADDGWFRFTGQLRLAGSSHECELLVDGGSFELPLIRLTNVPASLRPLAPHVASDGGLCYIAKGTVVLDIFDPVGQTLACVERAEQVLGQVLRGELIKDLEEEFFAYWGGSDMCLADLQGEGLGRHQSLFVAAGQNMAVVATDNPARTKKKLAAMGWQVSDEDVPIYRVRTTAKPRPSQGAWPPSTVSALLNWQGLLDKRCRKKIDQRVREAFATTAGGVVVIIESPLLTYAFGVIFRPKFAAAGKAARTGRKVEIHGLPVAQMTVIRMDDRYMAQRNVPGRTTLAGRSIAVIGCGTIGGYLADLLVKAGAGTSGGQLTLVDHEMLLPQNLGRHRLGFPGLFQNKAVALAAELQRGSPGCTLRPLPVDVRQAQLGAPDLLIDATGEEALGHWLAGEYTATSLLSVWIEGPGTAVRTLLHGASGGACYRCMAEHARAGHFRAVDGVLPSILAGQGCEGVYVPFPATVSVQAASLGAEVTLDWVNGILSPALRTRVVDQRFTAGTTDCDPPCHSGCPACGT
jgi:molybdopterin/thiamine biosynthesis adenylyltransferase